MKPWVDKRTARMCSNMVYETELGSVGPEMFLLQLSKTLQTPFLQPYLVNLLTQKSDEVGDTKQRNDNKESFCSFPVLMISWLPLPTRPQLGYHHIEDGDQEESIHSQQKQHRSYVDPLTAGPLKKRTLCFVHLHIKLTLRNVGPLLT